MAQAIGDALVSINPLEYDQTEFLFDRTKITRGTLAQIRRSILTNVSTLAINVATVYTNHTRYLSKNLLFFFGFTVLRSKRDDDAAIFTINVAASDMPRTVYAGDLQSKTDGVEVLQPLQPIMVLLPGERIDIEFEANRDTGATNPKYLPVTIVNTGETDKYLRLIIEPRGADSATNIFDAAVEAL